jgi:hypothetical protein
MKADRDQESTQKLPEAIPQGEFSHHDTEPLAFPTASLVAVRPPPICVNLKGVAITDRAGPLVVRENQSRRDLTKVAQYEVLG